MEGGLQSEDDKTTSGDNHTMVAPAPSHAHPRQRGEGGGGVGEENSNSTEIRSKRRLVW